MKQYEDVVHLVFAAINQIKAEGPQAYIHDEKKTMSNLAFDFLTARPARMTANMLASRLNSWKGFDGGDCDIEDVLYKPYASMVYRPNDIKNYLDLLTPKNCYIVHRDQAYKNEPDL